jgi:hypothetical protein
MNTEFRKVAAADQPNVAGVLVITKYRSGEVVSVSEPMPNKVVNSSGYGRNIIARQLTGDTTYAMAIDSAALGTGSTPPADTDTDLETPTVTGLSLTAASASSNVVQIDVFVADADLPNGTYREFGLFCDGRLFARVIVSPDYVKAAGEDTLFSYTLTITG